MPDLISNNRSPAFEYLQGEYVGDFKSNDTIYDTFHGP